MNDATDSPAINTSLPVPVELEELASGHLILKSHWSAPLRFLAAAPFSIYPFLLVAAITIVALAGVIDFMTGKVVVQDVVFAMSLAVISVIGFLRITFLVLLSWSLMKWRRGGPVDFDRQADQVVFGPGTDHLTLPLSTIAAVQLMATNALAGGAGIWEGLTGDWSKLSFLLRRLMARKKMYQLNLILKDGLRLNLANWHGWNEAEQELTQRLTEYLKVPLEGLGNELKDER